MTSDRVARAGALAVTVATNEDAGAINEAVRSLRVRAGQVGDTRVALGMAGVLFGQSNSSYLQRYIGIGFVT